MITVAQQEVTTAKNELNTTEDVFATAEHKLATAKHELYTAKNDLAIAKHELSTTKDKLAASKNNLATAGHELATAKHEHVAARHELATAKQKLATAKHKLSIAKDKLTTTNYKITSGYKFVLTERELKQEPATAKQEVATAEHELVAAEDGLVTAWGSLTAAKHRLATAESTFATAENRSATFESRWTTAHAEAVFITVEQRFTTAEYGFATAEQEFTSVKHKLAIIDCKYKAIVSVTTALDNLATDCLRLSMHFFYPIQQCAQQVYYTAVPLSPTLSQLHGSYLQSVMDNKSSPVTAFSGAPHSWGSLLRTIDVRPRQLTCVATSVHRLVASCEDIVNIYDAVTGVHHQSLHAPETVIRIQDSPDGSILFFGHSFSVTMWDVQTGGLIHTFTAQSQINHFTISMTGCHIACGLSDGSITFWDVHTKRGKSFGQQVVTICWVAPLELAVATQTSVYICDIIFGETSNTLSFPNSVCEMIYVPDMHGVLVGTSKPGIGTDQEVFSLNLIGYLPGHLQIHQPLWTPWMSTGRLVHPTLVGNEVVWITPPSGVQSFNTTSHEWTKNPPLLNTATSVAVSLGRNLVAQTKDSIQIFSLDVLTSDEAGCVTSPSYIYPRGKGHIACLQPNSPLTLLELETLQKLSPYEDTSPLRPLFSDQAPTIVMQAWCSGIPLPTAWTVAADEDPPLSGLSPNCTWFVTVSSPPGPQVRIIDLVHGTVLVTPIEHANLGMGEVYDLTFSSETRFYLKIDGQGWHVKIPYDIIPSLSGEDLPTITKGEPFPLSQPRATPLYMLDANHEWVIDAESRKICWIPPGNVRRGNGSHFWAGLSLVMVGGDGVVRKLTFREPDS